MSSGRSSRNQRSSLGSHDRKLRYKALLDDLSTLDLESADNDERVEKTANAVKEAQSLLSEGGVEERVKHPGEGFLDSRVLRAASDLAVRCSEAVSGNVHTYDSRALMQHIKENPDHWDFPLPHCAPPLAYLFGTFAPAPRPPRPPRAPRVKRERLPPGALQQPEDVERLDSTEENSEMVSRARRFITKAYRAAGSTPLSYFRTVLDPGSFSRSVENIYYVSFLVRDQLIELAIDEQSGLPTLSPLAPREAALEGAPEERQLVVSVDVQRWKDMVEALNITQPMMVLKRS